MIVAGLPYVSMEDNTKVIDGFQPVINNNDTLSKVRWLLGKACCFGPVLSLLRILWLRNEWIIINDD